MSATYAFQVGEEGLRGQRESTRIVKNDSSNHREESQEHPSQQEEIWATEHHARRRGT